MFDDAKTIKESKKVADGKVGNLSRSQLVMGVVNLNDMTKGKSEAIKNKALALYQEIRKDKVKKAYSSPYDLEKACDEIVEEFNQLINADEQVKDEVFELVYTFMEKHMDDEIIDIQVDGVDRDAMFFSGVISSMMALFDGDVDNTIEYINNRFSTVLHEEAKENFQKTFDAMLDKISDAFRNEGGESTISEMIMLIAIVVQYHLKFGLDANFSDFEDDLLNLEASEHIIQDYLDLNHEIQTAMEDILY